jgi:hypothetical protein
MADRVDVYAQSLLEIVVAEGNLSEVEDELFRFARIVEGNDELRITLSNPGLPLDRRAAIVDELLDNRALATTKAIAAFIVGAGRGHDLPAIVDRFAELAAQGRGTWPKCARPCRSNAHASASPTLSTPRASRSGEVIIDERHGWHRRHDRRHRHRRHRAPPPDQLKEQI